MKKTSPLLSMISADFGIQRGHPLPLGATVQRGGINFALFSRHASSVVLCLFAPGGGEEVARFPLDPGHNRTGDVWHAFVTGIDPGVEYGYRIDGPPERRHCFRPDQLLADPYATALVAPSSWGRDGARPPDAFRRSVIPAGVYDWGFDRPINRPLADSVIYEMHVRGFTRHPGSGARHPGTYRGVIEKIPYLKELGVTAVELLPVAEFDELDNARTDPATGAFLCNYWGYHPLSFFAVKAGYAAAPSSAEAVAEFKDMVKALHAAGIEVILDVVYNHTGEGDHRGPVYSMKGIDQSAYYMLDPEARHMNFSGCGNTVNCNQPYVREMIRDSLRYWVTEMHVDGFRFDLASILGRGQDGGVLASPPLLEQIAGDPVLAGTKLIAEAWDAAGLYQVGRFPNWGRWAEWNGCFRDDVRRFVRGDPGLTGRLATRLAGSADLYEHSREPGHGINFVTSHDGFCLSDLAAYDGKHNLANGEGNRDGDDNNLTWNCGAEGPTDDSRVNALRERQRRNLAALLLLSRGVPMILSGDEVGRSQGGNNNAYCQDNETSWFDWSLVERNAGRLLYFQRLIAFRKESALLRHNAYKVRDGVGVDIDWHGRRLWDADWSDQSRTLAMHLHGRTADGPADDVYLIANSSDEDADFQVPRLPGRPWRLVVDTSLDWETAASATDDRPVVSRDASYRVRARSVVALVAAAA